MICLFMRQTTAVVHLIALYEFLKKFSWRAFLTAAVFERDELMGLQRASNRRAPEALVNQPSYLMLLLKIFATTLRPCDIPASIDA